MLFIQSNYKVLKDDITSIMEELHLTNNFQNSMDTLFLTLIPKVENSTTLGDLQN